MNRLRERLQALAPLLVVIAIAAACFVSLGAPSLYETDEGFAATRADSFYRHHTWRLSYDNVGEDIPQFRKPPLLYWCVAALFKVFGRSMWAVRLPTALAGFLCAILTWRLARRFFDNATGLAAALLLVSVPFVLLHIRTAMLEMPLVCLMLAGAYGFAFLRHPPARVAAAGLAAGAAVLLKGGAGAYVLVIPLVFGLIHRRLRPAAFLEAILASLVAVLLPLAYFLAVPAEYRMTMLQRLFVEEASGRIRVFHHVAERLPGAITVLTRTLGWHLPSALLGFLLVAAGIRRHNAWERLAFLFFVILAALPLLWVYASMVHPFPRYLLPLYPLLLILSASFIRGALMSRWPILWLAPLAAAIAAMGPSPWRWIPAGIAAAIGLLSLRTRLSHPAFQWILLAGIAIPSALTPSARIYHPGPDRGPRPDLVPLAQQLQVLVPEHSKVVVEDRLKCHTILFHGRRSIDFVEDWLLTLGQPGESRYGIFRHAPPQNIPGVDITVVNRSGPWHLMKLTLSATNTPWAGILFAKTEQRGAIASMLTTMAIEATPFEKGFVLRHVPDTRPSPVQPRIRRDPDHRLHATDEPVAVAEGESLWLTFESPVPCAGFDLIASDKRERLEGWRVEYRSREEGEWTGFLSLEDPLASTYTITNGRLEKTWKRGLRLRFDPVTAKQWRFTRTSATPVTLSEVTAMIRK